MTAHIAVFNGGPAAGQVRSLQADITPVGGDSEPPLVVKVAEFRSGEVRMVDYLRSEKPMKNGHWAYAFVPPKD